MYRYGKGGSTVGSLGILPWPAFHWVLVYESSKDDYRKIYLVRQQMSKSKYMRNTWWFGIVVGLTSPTTYTSTPPRTVIIAVCTKYIWSKPDPWFYATEHVHKTLFSHLVCRSYQDVREELRSEVYSSSIERYESKDIDHPEGCRHGRMVRWSLLYTYCLGRVNTECGSSPSLWSTSIWVSTTLVNARVEYMPLTSWEIKWVYRVVDRARFWQIKAILAAANSSIFTIRLIGAVWDQSVNWRE